jgi:hypothetical protein
LSKFLKPFIPFPSILDPKPKNPLGYVTNDGMWAAIPLGNSKKYVIIHQGTQVTTLNTYNQAVDFINNQLKTKKRKSRSSNVRKKRKTS